jgi:hypothetical protein
MSLRNSSSSFPQSHKGLDSPAHLLPTLEKAPKDTIREGTCLLLGGIVAVLASFCLLGQGAEVKVQFEERGGTLGTAGTCT